MLAQPTLKRTLEPYFMVGAALNESQFSERDRRDADLVARHFNTITPENALKWQYVHPEPDRYAFAATDRYVDFGERNGMFIIGHTLVWHNQTPEWVFQDDEGRPLDRDALLARMRDHIHTVVGRYKGRIHGWDVVNEALNEDGTLRDSPWYRIIGEDYVGLAFFFAHEADPDAELYYNDYGLENTAKRDGAVNLIRRLQREAAPIDGVGLQGHNRLEWPTPEAQDSTIAAFAQLGLQVMITELDVDVLPRGSDYRGVDLSQDPALQARIDPYREVAPDSLLRLQADQYARLFNVYLKHSDVISRVTFWGVDDGDSWLNNWPVRGRTNYPLLFNRVGQPKPAYDAVMGAVRAHRSAH
ncbi:MAG: endo-1,4-beta-xylanase [Rhodothermales bacterium]